jgi:ketosteroid isomerase-like protein
MRRSIQILAALLISLAGCSSGTATGTNAADVKAIETAVHGGYVAAINSNDVETLMASLTDDIVYQAPGEPEVVGKAAVGKWVAA